MTVTVANAEVTAVKNAGSALNLETDYTWQSESDILTIKKEYLSGLSAKTKSATVLTIETDNGTCELTVNVTDTTGG